MYNEIILTRLNDLKYLGQIKNSNISIVSKDNKYGDVVKFFAQINTDNIIQLISFKAKGCTSFLAMCSFFCELVDKHTISDSMKITREDLEKYCSLDECKDHVYAIILDTFALLIKKYQKGVSKGLIVPAEIAQIDSNKPTKKTSKKSINISDDLSDILYVDNSKTSGSKDNKMANNDKTNENTTNDVIKPIEKKKPSKSAEKKEKSKSDLVGEELIISTAKEESTKLENNKKVVDIKVVDNNQEINKINSQIEEIVRSDNISTKQDKELESAKKIKKTTKIKDNKKKTIVENQNNNISTLNKLIQNNKVNNPPTSQDNKVNNTPTNQSVKANNLSMMLSKLNNSKNEKIEKKDSATIANSSNKIDLGSLKNSLSSLHNKNNKEMTNNSAKSQEQPVEEKNKKSLFSWLKKSNKPKK